MTVVTASGGLMGVSSTSIASLGLRPTMSTRLVGKVESKGEGWMSVRVSAEDQLSVVTQRNLTTHMKRVTKEPGGCWIYALPVSKRGRPRITVNGVDMAAYQFFWLAFTRKPVPEDSILLHSCDRGDEGCVNPAHLSIGTHDDNMREMKERGRGRNQHTQQAEEAGA